MPQTPVKTPLYPDVPPSPGVPQVKRDPLAPINTILLLEADVGTIVRMFEPPQWGIFTADGRPLVIPDTVESLDYRAEARISDYPVENGGFQSYDKVVLPYDARVVMICDGTNQDKTSFLLNLERARLSLDTFVVLTPDVVYPNVNIIHYDYRRTRQRGATMIYAEIWLQEIRFSNPPQFANTQQNAASPSLTDTQNPVSQSDVNKGTVQPTATTLPVPPIPPLASETVVTTPAL